MNVNKLWLANKATDDQILHQTNKMAGLKKNKNLIIFTGSYALQHFDYMPYLQRDDFESLGLNYCYLMPGAQKLSFMFHGSMAAVKAYQDSSTFKYFSKDFKGCHIFMAQTAKCSKGPYGICSKADVQKTIKINGINRFLIATHALPNKGLAWVPSALSQYNAGEVPFGCSGTLNAMVLPMALKFGYKNIYIVGVGDTNLVHFYDVEWSQKQLRKPKVNPFRNLSLTRYKKWNQLAKKSGTRIVVVPGKIAEASIKAIFETSDHI